MTAVPAATIKRDLADWQVTEMAASAFSGEGEHGCYFVEKQGLDTETVAQAVAAELGLPRAAVGYAGRKDRWGITRQWFSVQDPRTAWPDIDGTRCLQQSRHARKLRTGELAGNQFEITLRDCEGVDDTVVHRLGLGFANLYGPQRLGGDNVAQARQWLLERPHRRPRGKKRRAGPATSRGQQGWHLSVLRSYLFNQVVERRLAADTAHRVIEGDVLVNGFPSAPLWGRGRSQSVACAAEEEAAALAPHAPLCEALEFAGLQQARRQMYVRPQGFVAQKLADDCLKLCFTLPAGAYATSLLNAQVHITDARADALRRSA